MKKYYLFNWTETKVIFVGNFNSDKEFWKYYWNNEKELVEKQNKLDSVSKSWHMASF
jgi:hypothetical protein